MPKAWPKRSTSARSDAVTPAWLYDGESAVRRTAAVAAEGGALRIAVENGPSFSVGLAELVHVESRDGAEIYRRAGVDGWRLGLVSPPASLVALLPRGSRYGRWIDRVGLVPALLGGLAVSALVLLAVQRLPDWLAPLVPPSWEQKFGDALVGDLGARVCSSEEGQRALDKLTARLTPHAGRLNVHVVDIDLVNAVALPGGNIVLFRDLLTEAESPGEAAGVLAHEIAHIENRDVTRALIRHVGFGLVIASFGGTTGANIDTLMSARYSQKAESRADADAIAALRRADISPLPAAAFFDRLADMGGEAGAISGTLQYLSSHPPSGERSAKFRRSAVPEHRYRPALSKEEWGALQDICWEGPTPATPVEP
jgi:beta-barrel assembly-enhancing protease